MAYGGRIFKDLGASRRAPMPRFSTLFAPIRQSLLERDDPFDPFQPLDEVRRKRPPVSLPKRPRNRADDVGRVEGAPGRAGVLGGARKCPDFDTRLGTGVRDFQRQKGLKVDGLLNPGGPTIHTLGRALCLAAAEGALGRGGFGQRPAG